MQLDITDAVVKALRLPEAGKRRKIAN